MLIIYFNIPDKTIRDLLVEHREFVILNNVNDEYLTDQKIDLLLSKDDIAIADYFAKPGTISKNGKIYSPKWIYMHTT